jgi:hypothetical protein
MTLATIGHGGHDEHGHAVAPMRAEAIYMPGGGGAR